MIRKKILKNIENEYITESDLLKKLDITHEKLKQHLLDLKEAGYLIKIDAEKGHSGFRFGNSYCRVYI